MTRLEFDAGATAQLLGHHARALVQAGAVVAGGAGADVLEIHPGGGDLDLTGLQFSNWSLTDRLMVRAESNMAFVVGSVQHDVIMSSAWADRLHGGEGNDLISGGAAYDELYGDAGDDVLEGGADWDALDGGAGADTASYANSAGVAVNLGLTGAQGTAGAGYDTLISIENIAGSAFNDVLVGNALANVLIGAAGADRLEGAAGDDRFVLGAATDGVDQIYGGAQGADSGFDTLDYSTATAGVIVQFLGWSTTSGNAVLTNFSEIEGAIGSSFNDSLIGAAANNRLTGGAGGHWLVGGGGADTFVYQTLADGAGESIRDFSRTEADRIDLSAIDANPGAGGDQAFTFSLARTPGAVGQAVATTFASSTLISLYVDADNIADMTIQVVHQPQLVIQGDFVL